MTTLVTDVSRIPERHKQELLRGERVRAELAILEQRKLKEASDLLDRRHIEGLGQHVMCITPEMAARLRVRYGMGCLHDPEFRKRLLQRNPFLRVNSKARRFSLRVDGRRRSEVGSRNGEKQGAGNHVAQGEPAKPLTHGKDPRANFGHETRTGVTSSVPTSHFPLPASTP